MTTSNDIPATVSPSQAAGMQASALFLDVRTPGEFEQAHIEGAVLHPLSELNPEAVRQKASGKSACVVICRTGNRARQAARRLTGVGHQNVRVLEGGLQAWQDAGLPVMLGRKSISLERQVRIAAGTLVVIGAALGYFVHPAWMALSAFVGAGLVFAGITDTCGMGMLLARMPWNNRRSCATGACSSKP